eukprot:TRINITY_DN11816_c1_g1_i2.p1 TRINITY_DN11816_c1_g1~~TRINITY_DN11816_c1_g1_i2.p1  ORF type:complete len:140 (-),score=20.64 TRINITY_DN11816_c1_g1_i2:122-541(-)
MCASSSRLDAAAFKSTPTDVTASTTCAKVLLPLTKAVLRMHAQKQAGARLLSPHAFESMPASIAPLGGVAADAGEKKPEGTLAWLHAEYGILEEGTLSSSSGTTRGKVNMVVPLTPFAKAGLAVYRAIALGRYRVGGQW